MPCDIVKQHFEEFDVSKVKIVPEVKNPYEKKFRNGNKSDRANSFELIDVNEQENDFEFL